MLERLQKIIARAGIASRRHAEELIVSGQVRVNGVVVTELGAKADPEVDRVEAAGRVAEKPAEVEYYMLHKPPHVVSTMSDPEGRGTIRHLLRGLSGGIFPVGRLDYASSGLILLTTDGVLADRIFKISASMPQVYWVKVAGRLDDEALQEVRRRAQVRMRRLRAPGSAQPQPENPWFEVEMNNSSNDLLRQTLFAMEHPVEKMKRVKLGPLDIGALPEMEYRKLEQEEIAQLRAAVERAEKAPRPPAGKRVKKRFRPRPAPAGTVQNEQTPSVPEPQPPAAQGPVAQLPGFQRPAAGGALGFQRYGRPSGPGFQKRGPQGPGGDRPRFQRPGTAGPGFQRQGPQGPGSDQPKFQRPGPGGPGFQKRGPQGPGGDRPRFQRPGTGGPGFQKRGPQGPGGDRPRFQRPGTGGPGFQKRGPQGPGGDRSRFQRPGTGGPGFQRQGPQGPGSDRPKFQRPGTGGPGFQKRGPQGPGGDRSRFQRPGTGGPGFQRQGPQGPGSDRPKFQRPDPSGPSSDRPRFQRPESGSSGFKRQGPKGPGPHHSTPRGKGPRPSGPWRKGKPDKEEPDR